MLPRRSFLRTLAAGAAAPVLARAGAPEPFRLRHVLASALYGGLPLADILPEVAKVGAEGIDIWCKVHGTQREQIDAMGDEAFAALLARHRVRLIASTRYPLGPFGLQPEIAWLRRHGGGIVVTGSRGPRAPQGAEAKVAVQAFLEQMKPHVAAAEAAGVTIAIENHGSQMLCHPDSLRWFAELNRSRHLGVAFAPHHLHPWSDEIPRLVRDLGAGQLPFVYLQEHNEGISRQVAKEIELRQLPGFGGGLDWRELVRALRDIRFTGWVEIFMHPTPRGIPILPTLPEVTAAVTRARAHIDQCLREVAG